MNDKKINKVTAGLDPYPMEELTRIKKELVKRGRPVFDFGTGDPRIPTWAPIRDALLKNVPEISQYPSVKGSDELKEAQQGYLQRRFGIKPDTYDVIPSQGSKEAIFHIALCLVGRAGGKKHIVYPDPGYPVYKSSTKFAGGTPYPVQLTADNGFLLEPWNLPPYVQRDAAAIWINYPHNPTGASAPHDYWVRLVEWAHKTDTILLSDDCYVDIYDSAIDEQMGSATPSMETDPRPMCPLMLSSDRVLTFMSLSKRSGMTGYRAGLIAGDKDIVAAVLKARANFGVGSPDFVQHASAVAWGDDGHVAERRRIFTQRIKKAAPVFQDLRMLDDAPNTAFYLWTRIPSSFGQNDIRFCLALAEHGVISSPSQWLSESVKGYARFALVPGDEDTEEALEIIKAFVDENS